MPRCPPILGNLKPTKETKEGKIVPFPTPRVDKSVLYSALTQSALFVVPDAEFKILCLDGEFLWGAGSRGFSKWLSVTAPVLASDTATPMATSLAGFVSIGSCHFSSLVHNQFCELLNKYYSPFKKTLMHFNWPRQD